MKYSACSFTGHRQISNGNMEALKAVLERAVRYVYSQGCLDFYAGGAVGFDTLAALAVLDLRREFSDVKLHMVLPCINQSERWSLRQKAEYQRILELADSIEYTGKEYYEGCMRVRNLRLVELCDVLVAYVGRRYGGSYQTLSLANSRGKEVFNLYGKK